MITSLSSYRPTEEVQGVRRERDPIKKVEKYALEGNLITEEELKVCGCSEPEPSSGVLCGHCFQVSHFV